MGISIKISKKCGRLKRKAYGNGGFAFFFFKARTLGLSDEIFHRQVNDHLKIEEAAHF